MNVTTPYGHLRRASAQASIAITLLLIGASILIVLCASDRCSAESMLEAELFRDWAETTRLEGPPPLIDYNLRMGVRGHLVKDYYSSILYLQEFLLHNPESIYSDYVHFYLGLSLREIDLVGRSAFHFRKILFDYHDSLFMRRALLNLLLIYFDQEEYRGVIDTYERFKSSDSASLYTGRWIIEFVPKEILYLVGQSHFLLGEFEDAKQVLRRLQPGSSEHLYGLYTLAQIEFMGGRVESAVEILDTVIESPFVTSRFLFPIVDHAILTKGRILYETGHYDEAIETYLEINLSSLFYPEAIEGVGWALICQEELALAVTYFSELLTFHPERQKVSEIIGTIGRLYSTMGDPTGAIPFFENAKVLITREIASLEASIESPEQLDVVFEDLRNIHYHNRIIDKYLDRRESIRQDSYFPKNRMFPYLYRSYLQEKRLAELLELDFEMKEVLNLVERVHEDLPKLEALLSQVPQDLITGDSPERIDIDIMLQGEKILWWLSEIRHHLTFGNIRIFDIDTRHFNLLQRHGVRGSGELSGPRAASIEQTVDALTKISIGCISTEALRQRFLESMSRVRRYPGNLETREKLLRKIVGRRELVEDIEKQSEILAGRMVEISGSIPLSGRPSLLTYLMTLNRNLMLIEEIHGENLFATKEPFIRIDFRNLRGRFEDLAKLPEALLEKFARTRDELTTSIELELRDTVERRLKEMTAIALELDFHLSRNLLLKTSPQPLEKPGRED